MTAFAMVMATSGFTLRSGGADGADSAFERGAGELVDIYIPWKGFNNLHDSHYIDSSKLPNYGAAKEMASHIHPAWDACSAGAKSLHTRNVYQVLGSYLNNPSSFLLFWAQPVGRSGAVKGGTNTAVQLAISEGIETFNLYNESVMERILNKIKNP